MHIHDTDAERNSGTRTTPHNIELEQAVLGCLLVNADAVQSILDIVEPGHFYDPLHARICDAIATQYEAGRAVSPVALASKFAGEDVGIPVTTYLGRMAIEAPRASVAIDYAKTVRELATRRGLIAVADQLAWDAMATDGPAVDALITATETGLYQLASKGKYGQGAVSFGEALDAAVEQIEAAYRSGNDIVGISTGLRDLDERLGGVQPGELTIIAGRPSMGKTALAVNIAFDAAARGAPVDFYSLEMTDGDLVRRVLADRLRVGSDKLRRGQVTPAQMAELVEDARRLRHVPLTIDPSGGLTIAQLSARARKQKRAGKTELIVVDYLQLLNGSRRDGRVNEVTEITTGLKALAKELDVPVIALSQLSRAVESREDKRPMLADLRESGSIEQDADVVMFVYREEYYLERTKPDFSEVAKFADWEAKFSQVEGLGEIIIGKSRHAPVGIVKVKWDGARTRFFDLGVAQ